MKKLSLTKGCFRNTLLSLTILISISINLVAQTNFPVIQWGIEYNHFQNPSDQVNKNSLDWALQIKQIKDGNFISCGFTSRWEGDPTDPTPSGGPVNGCYNSPRPAIFKVNYKGDLLWKHAYDVSSNSNTTIDEQGRFDDIIEIENGHFVAVGSKTTQPSNVGQLFIIEIDADGNVVKNKTVIYNNCLASAAKSLCRSYNSSGIPDGYALTGSITTTSGSDYDIFLMKLNNNLDGTFSNSSEWCKVFPNTGKDESFSVKAYFNNGVNTDGTPVSGNYNDFSGFIACGYQSNSTGADIWITKTDANGNITWTKLLDESKIPNYSYITGHCPCTNGLSKTSSDWGRSIIETHDGSIVISAWANWYLGTFAINSMCSNGCLFDANNKRYNTDNNPTNLIDAYDYYQFADLVLLKYNLSGSLTNSNFIHTMSGADFAPIVKETYDFGFAVVGTTADIDDEPSDMGTSIESKLMLIKTNSNFNAQWVKLFVESDADECGCGFGLDVTSDGGYVVCGNNGNENDNYIIVKLSGDCERNIISDIGNYELPSSETWSTNKTVTGTVIIEKGKTLTINNGAVIQFGSFDELYGLDQTRSAPFDQYNYVGIIIQPGGRLIVNGATLTSIHSCNNSKWDGILVEGDPTKEQFPTSNQGVINLNNAVIENANNAISTSSTKNVSGQYVIDWAKTGGGIIYATNNTTFRNNGRHVAFYAYNSPTKQNNVSTFLDCIFEVNGSTDISTLGYNNKGVMVTAWGVKGVHFTGCEFKNTNGSVNADKMNFDRGTGILTYDASLIVDAHLDPSDCHIIKSGRFYDLSKGIHSYFSSSSTFAGEYKHQSFERNDKGVWLLNGVSTSIHHNTFDLYVPSSYWMRAYSSQDNLLLNSGIAGIIARDAGGYHIEQNNFTNTGILNSLSDARTSNEVVLATVLDNADAAPGGGTLRLNTHFGLNLGTQTQYNNTSINITCNPYTNINSAIRMNPLSSTSNTPFFGQCISGISFQNFRTDYGNTFFGNLTYDAEHDPSGLIKAYVIDPSATNGPTSYYQMNYDNCSGLSGNKTVIPKDQCIPNTTLKDLCGIVIWQNPDPNKDAYYSFKTSRNSTQDNINTAGLADDALAQAQSELAYYTREMVNARDYTLWAYNISSLYDSTVNWTDSIISFLTPETDLDSRKLLIATLYYAGNHSAAQQYISTITSDQNNNETLQFINFYNLMINAHTNSRNIFQLNDEEWNTIAQIASTGTSAAESAKGILTLVKGQYFNSYIERPAQQYGKRALSSKPKAKQTSNEIAKPIIGVYPNPANTNLTIGYVLNNISSDACIKVLDISGRVLSQKSITNIQGSVEFNTTSFRDGLYFIQLYSGNLIQSVTKVIINH